MKRKFTREMTIGLSLLAVLLVILGAVSVWRFRRPGIPPESTAAAEEVKHEEERSEERRLKRETDAALKPDVLTPVATNSRDSLQQLDDPGHWKNAEKERRKEGLAGAPALGLSASDPQENIRPTLSRSVSEEHHELAQSASEERHKHDGERTSTYAPPELPPGTGNDRYSPAAANESTAEHRKRDNSGLSALTPSPSPAYGRGEPVVIQVSNGDSVDGSPRPLDRYDSHAGGDRHPGIPAAETFGPEGQAHGRFDRQAAGMAADSEAARQHEEKARERELHNNATAADGTGPVPTAAQPFGRFDGQGAGMAVDPEAARRQAEKVRERELQAVGSPVDPAAGRNAYMTEASRGAPAPPYYSSAPSGDAAAGYSQAPGGYAPDRVRRPSDEFHDPMRPQNPLRDDGMYEVQPNDSYWTISERVYGSGSYFRALAEQNRGKAARPDRLPPGLLISTPPVARLEKDYPDLCPRPNRRETVRNRAATASMAATAGGGRTYVVQEGDTLSSIARNELGKVSRWAELYQINREALGKDYDYLVPGMRLVLPIRDNQPGDRTTRRDDNGAPLMR